MSAMRVILFVAISVCLIATAFGQADPCLKNLANNGITFGFAAPRYDGLALRQWKVKSVDMMRACLTSIPFSATDATQTIDAIQEYLLLYPFLDINRYAILS